VRRAAAAWRRRRARAQARGRGARGHARVRHQGQVLAAAGQPARGPAAPRGLGPATGLVRRDAGNLAYHADPRRQVTCGLRVPIRHLGDGRQLGGDQVSAHSRGQVGGEAAQLISHLTGELVLRDAVRDRWQIERAASAVVATPLRTVSGLTVAAAGRSCRCQASAARLNPPGLSDRPVRYPRYPRQRSPAVPRPARASRPVRPGRPVVGERTADPVGHGPAEAVTPGRALLAIGAAIGAAVGRRLGRDGPSGRHGTRPGTTVTAGP